MSDVRSLQTMGLSPQITMTTTPVDGDSPSGREETGAVGTGLVTGSQTLKRGAPTNKLLIPSIRYLSPSGDQGPSQRRGR